MGFLKRFFRNVFREGNAPEGGSSFARISQVALESHLSVVRYGEFYLSDAVRPSFDLKVVPEQGYRHDRYKDDSSGASIPVLMGSASKEILFDTFLDLIDILGESVDVILESSHSSPENKKHDDLQREEIDVPVLKSYLYEFEDMLTNDGCTGIAVMNPKIPLEIQFDEHKLLVVYGYDLKAFEKVFVSHGILKNNSIKFITEAEHVHSSKESYIEQFDKLQIALGMENVDRWRAENRM